MKIKTGLRPMNNLSSGLCLDECCSNAMLIACRKIGLHVSVGSVNSLHFVRLQ